jgi:hypothetical protein
MHCNLSFAARNRRNLKKCVMFPNCTGVSYKEVSTKVWYDNLFVSLIGIRSISDAGICVPTWVTFGSILCRPSQTLTLATIQRYLSFVNTITRNNLVHKRFVFHIEWRQQTTLLCNKLLLSNTVPAKLQEAVSLAVSEVRLGREAERYLGYIPKQKLVQEFIR